MAIASASSVRSLVKTGTARALAWTRADALIGAMTGSRLPALVLGYHRVVDSFAAEARWAIPANLTSRRMLEQQVDWVGRRFRFVTLDELGERLLGGDTEPVAAVTFDDGYRDVYEHAFPLLTRKGIPAAVFVVTDLVGTVRLQRCDQLYLLLMRAFTRWSDAPAMLGRLLHALDIRVEPLPATALIATVQLLRSLPRSVVDRVIEVLDADVELRGVSTDSLLPMTWDMLADMKRAGMTVGSHTRSHPLLPLEKPDIVAAELWGARAEIEQRLGGPVRHFAYPDGQVTREAAAAVAAAGYRFAYTTCTYRDPDYPLLTVPRLMLWENACLDAGGRFSPAIMSCQAHGVFGLMRRCEHEHRA